MKVFYSQEAVHRTPRPSESKALLHSTREGGYQRAVPKVSLGGAGFSGADGRSLAEKDVAVAVGGRDGKSDLNIDGSIGLDGDAGSDRGQGGGDGARVTLGGEKVAQVVAIRVDDAVEESANNGQVLVFTIGHWGIENTSAGGANLLSDAERVG